MNPGIVKISKEQVSFKYSVQYLKDKYPDIKSWYIIKLPEGNLACMSGSVFMEEVHAKYERYRLDFRVYPKMCPLKDFKADHRYFLGPPDKSWFLVSDTDGRYRYVSNKKWLNVYTNERYFVYCNRSMSLGMFCVSTQYEISSLNTHQDLNTIAGIHKGRIYRVEPATTNYVYDYDTVEQILNLLTLTPTP